jgi:hypothetical protein
METFADPLTEYSPQMEALEPSRGLMLTEGSRPAAFTEEQELELASELLEVADEQELDNFLGDLIKQAGNALGKIVKSPMGHAISGVLKSAAKTVLPVAGGALGGFVGGPLGAALGSNLASMAGSALGLELEGLSPEDREFEACKQFVRFAGAAAKNALEADADEDPARLAYLAAVKAARTQAPGLMNIGEDSAQARQENRRSGRWIRHRRKIILLGV